ncbi:MAG: hypothetical protein JWN44_6049 [Myxococcales bacterium]|nr:hypothetical protein [Myxococcales bacterium]
MKLVKAAALVALLLCARTTYAAEQMKVGFLIDFVNGVSIPISDSKYKDFADASFKMGVRAGLVLYVSRHLGVAPEAEFDFIPVNSNDATYQKNGADARFYRLRGLIGGRLILPFSVGSFYVRAMIGIDHIRGNISASAFGVTVSQDYSTTGFTFEPGVGVQFNVAKHFVVGFTTGFPIALHDFGTNRPVPSSFTAVDVDFLGVLGVRL